MTRCPSCGAPVTVKSLTDGGCEYCKTAYSHPNDNFNTVKLYADNQLYSEIIMDSQKISMRTGYRGYEA